MSSTDIVSLLGKFIGTRAMRNNVIASNIANVDTPEFKSRDIQFKAELKGVVDDQSSKEWSFKPKESRNMVSMREDGNSVNMEIEMAKLVGNSAEYMAATKLLARRIAMMKYAITGGG